MALSKLWIYCLSQTGVKQPFASDTTLANFVTLSLDVEAILASLALHGLASSQIMLMQRATIGPDTSAGTVM